MSFYDNIKKNLLLLIEKKTELKNLYSLDTKYKKNINQLTFKINNYKKWLTVLENERDLINNITSIENINELKLSKGLTTRIKEIFETGELNDIKSTSIDISIFIKENQNINIPTNSILDDEIDNLKLIHGIADKTAKKMIEQNNITLDKLKTEWNNLISSDNDYEILMIEKNIDNLEIYKNNVENIDRLIKYGKTIVLNKFQDTQYLKYLHYEQLVGLKHINNINERIPRAEILIIENIIKTIASKISDDIIINICGSFRRGKNESGDVDVLLTHKKCLYKNDIMNANPNPLNILIYYLTKINFLVDHLTLSGGTKYMGLCKINNSIPRRIDIRFIAYKSLGCSLLYFTGSKEFNKKMRTHALKKGYSLSEYGLIKMEGRKKTDNIIYYSSEKEVFEFLEYPFKTPIERNI